MSPPINLWMQLHHLRKSTRQCLSSTFTVRFRKSEVRDTWAGAFNDLFCSSPTVGPKSARIYNEIRHLQPSLSSQDQQVRKDTMNNGGTDAFLLLLCRSMSFGAGLKDGKPDTRTKRIYWKTMIPLVGLTFISVE